ncbi:UNKNOWN [Stylonychia lemnae]|uniref:DBF4-type domain-containing protein n=1 Tax=Stylonychia lemnae TaxID=5949 RepID=A0A078B6S2_STYLE|nr:UNKNOWN [Stylonychia lemnae]|eukprot:CDW90079.1 UNKNOWN [Stylonychia lemnae]
MSQPPYQSHIKSQLSEIQPNLTQLTESSFETNNLKSATPIGSKQQRVYQYSEYRLQQVFYLHLPFEKYENERVKISTKVKQLGGRVAFDWKDTMIIVDDDLLPTYYNHQKKIQESQNGQIHSYQGASQDLPQSQTRSLMPNSLQSLLRDCNLNRMNSNRNEANLNTTSQAAKNTGQYLNKRQRLLLNSQQKSIPLPFHQSTEQKSQGQASQITPEQDFFEITRKILEDPSKTVLRYRDFKLYRKYLKSSQYPQWFIKKDITKRLEKLNQNGMIHRAFVLIGLDKGSRNNHECSHVFLTESQYKENQEQFSQIERRYHDHVQNHNKGLSQSSDDCIQENIPEPIPPQKYCEACSDMFHSYFTHISTVQHKYKMNQMNQAYYNEIDAQFDQLKRDRATTQYEFLAQEQKAYELFIQTHKKKLSPIKQETKLSFSKSKNKVNDENSLRLDTPQESSQIVQDYPKQSFLKLLSGQKSNAYKESCLNSQHAGRQINFDNSSNKILQVVSRNQNSISKNNENLNDSNRSGGILKSFIYNDHPISALTKFNQSRMPLKRREQLLSVGTKRQFSEMEQNSTEKDLYIQPFFSATSNMKIINEEMDEISIQKGQYSLSSARNDIDEEDKSSEQTSEDEHDSSSDDESGVKDSDLAKSQSHNYNQSQSANSESRNRLKSSSQYDNSYNNNSQQVVDSLQTANGNNQLDVTSFQSYSYSCQMGNIYNYF